MIESVNNERVKEIAKLHDKKYRKINNKFLAVGKHLVEEALKKNLVLELYLLVGTPNTYSFDATYVSEKVMKKLSEQTSSPKELAVCKIENNNEIIGNVVILDNIKDPGNLGTIIRLADWFGIEHIFCSPDTVDVYNTKTIQATMGGLARVKVHYTSLRELIEANPQAPIYGTFLDGENLYDEKLNQKGLIIMGNEGNGISEDLRKVVTHKLYIPNYPLNKESAESLNVAIATAVVCAEFRRQALL